jgi:aminopeptidase N
VNEILPAMYEDGFSSSHPIQVDIQKGEESRLLLDSITFSKSAAVFRMFEGIIGRAEFQKAIRV